MPPPARQSASDDLQADEGFDSAPSLQRLRQHAVARADVEGDRQGDRYIVEPVGQALRHLAKQETGVRRRCRRPVAVAP